MIVQDKAVYNMLVQINTNLTMIKTLLEEWKKYGLNVRTREEHG